MKIFLDGKRRKLEWCLNWEAILELNRKRLPHIRGVGGTNRFHILTFKSMEIKMINRINVFGRVYFIMIIFFIYFLNGPFSISVSI